MNAGGRAQAEMAVKTLRSTEVRGGVDILEGRSRGRGFSSTSGRKGSPGSVEIKT